jgi:hypothetical protein
MAAFDFNGAFRFCRRQTPDTRHHTSHRPLLVSHPKRHVGVVPAGISYSPARGTSGQRAFCFAGDEMRERGDEIERWRRNRGGARKISDQCKGSDSLTVRSVPNPNPPHLCHGTTLPLPHLTGPLSAWSHSPYSVPSTVQCLCIFGPVRTSLGAEVSVVVGANNDGRPEQNAQTG